MKRFSFLAVLSFFLAWPVAAQDVPLDIKGDVVIVKVDRVITIREDRTVVRSLPFTVEAPAVGDIGFCLWTYPATITAIDKGAKLEVTAAPKGSLVISAKVITANLDKDGKFLGFVTKFYSVSFDVGEATPPVPPKPPDPPKPPTPTGLRVLIVNESGMAMTVGQYNVWSSTELKAWLDAKCVKESDGLPGWRKWDKDVVLVKQPEPIKALWEATKPKLTALPCIVIVTDAAGEIFPLPETIAATLALLKKRIGE